MVHPETLSRLPVEELRIVESVCSRFEDGHLSGTRAILQCVRELQGAVRSQAIFELTLLDLEATACLESEFMQQLGEFDEPADREAAERAWRFQQNQNVDSTNSVGECNELQSTRYQIKQLIGQGGLGAIYRVFDKKSARTMAMKCVLPRFRGDSLAIDRLRREAILTGQLQHPAIPPIYDSGQLDSGDHYFVMKLIDGRTFESILSARNNAAENLAQNLNIFQQIAQAVAYAHSQSVIHRDLKPHNVMVGQFGEVQVMDWGMARRIDSSPIGSTHTTKDSFQAGKDVPTQDLAASLWEKSNSNLPECDAAGSDERPIDSRPIEHRETRAIAADSSIEVPIANHPMAAESKANSAEHASRLTRAGEIVGTPNYMPPEQARGEAAKVGYPSDTFGLGAILFEILTGDRLYSQRAGDPLMAAAHGDLTVEFELLNKCSVPAPLKELCRDCLQPIASERPHSASVVATRTTSYLVGIEERLQRAKIEDARKETMEVEQRKRRRIRNSLATALVVSLLVGVFAVGHQWQKTTAALVKANENYDRAVEQKKLADEQRRIATEQSDLSLSTLTEVIRIYQTVLDTTRSQTKVSEEAERARREILTLAVEGMKQISDRLKKSLDYSANLIIAHQDLGDTYIILGAENFEDGREFALDEYELALDAATHLAANDTEDPLYAKRLLAISHERIAQYHFSYNEMDDALIHVNKAIDILEPLWEANPRSKAMPHALLHQYFLESGVQFRKFAIRDAIQSHRRALKLVEQAIEREVDFAGRFENEYIIPELETRLMILQNMELIREDPSHALSLDPEVGPRALYDTAAWLAALGEVRESFELLERMDDFENLSANRHYDRACGYSRCIKTLDSTDDSARPDSWSAFRSECIDRAVASLDAAKEGGFFGEPSAKGLIRRDPDLDTIRDSSLFTQFEEQLFSND